LNFVFFFGPNRAVPFIIPEMIFCQPQYALTSCWLFSNGHFSGLHQSIVGVVFGILSMKKIRIKKDRLAPGMISPERVGGKR